MTAVTDYLRQDWSHSRFEEVDFSQSRFHNVYFQDTVIRGAWLQRVDIDGLVDQVTINGVDVGPLIEAELDRRDPDRTLVRPTDADGFRARLGGRRTPLGRRRSARAGAARGPAARARRRRVVLHRDAAAPRLRHRRLGAAGGPGRPGALPPARAGPHRDAGRHPGGAARPDARPSLDEILAVRAERMATVARVLGELTDERLDGMTEPVLEPGYPASESFPVRRCLGTVINEEWLHREFAERDLAVLEARSA